MVVVEVASIEQNWQEWLRFRAASVLFRKSVNRLFKGQWLLFWSESGILAATNSIEFLDVLDFGRYAQMATRKTLLIILGAGVVLAAISTALVMKRLSDVKDETNKQILKNEAVKFSGEQFKSMLSELSAAESRLMVTQRYFLDTPDEKSFKNLESDYDAIIKSLDALLENISDSDKVVAAALGDTDEKSRADYAQFLKTMAGLSADIRIRKQNMADRKARIKSARVKIIADEIWQGSGLNAVKDDVVICTAKGQWRWGVSLGGWVDGRGEAGSAGYRLVSALGNGALLCAIKGSDKLNAALSHFSADRSGEVVLQINDTLVGDNRGHLDVTVFTFPWFDGKY
ncbi:MAG: hypothetical protein IBJ18_02150 [Phycisphaerales bacterium]|nr:hypothetical protein [Phycisphaerales bacterium]